MRFLTLLLLLITSDLWSDASAPAPNIDSVVLETPSALCFILFVYAATPPT